MSVVPYPKAETFLKVGALKRFVHARGKLLGRDFLPLMEGHIRRRLDAACRVHNGGRKTLDASVAGHVGLLS